MKRILRFFQLSSTDQCLLVKSALLLGTIRLGLWLISFGNLQCLLARMTPRTAKLRDADQASTDRVVWAIAKVAPYVPAATCLTKALATQVLLARRGYPTCVRIGVVRSEEGKLWAHAWVESQGKIIIGGVEDLSHFALLPPLEEGNL